MTTVRDHTWLWKLALALLVSFCTRGASGTELNGRSVTLPPPAGYCSLNTSIEPEATWFREMAALLAPQNRLLAYAVPCTELEHWRRNPDAGPTRTVTIYTPQLILDRRVVTTRAAWLALISPHLDRAFGNTGRVTGQVNENFARDGFALRATDITYLGVLRRTDDALFAAQIQRYDAAGSAVAQLASSAMTVLSGIPMQVAMAETVSGNDWRVAPLLDALQRYVRLLVSSNP